jgi:AcrR family transcriptional regulator
VPKLVDPEARRGEVVDAVFRVVCRDGLEHASLRNIAQEAGLAIGSVRHYFTSHAELTAFALQALVDRVNRRVMAHLEHLQDGDWRTLAECVLAEFLPLDEPRREEATVWLAFITAARTRADLRPHAQKIHDGLRFVAGRLLKRARAGGVLRSGRDLPLETERLCAILDGLALGAVLQPQSLPPRMVRRALAAHLDELFQPAGRA